MPLRGNSSERGNGSAPGMGKGGITGGNKLGGSIEIGSLGWPGSGLNCAAGAGEEKGVSGATVGVGVGTEFSPCAGLGSWACAPEQSTTNNSRRLNRRRCQQLPRLILTLLMRWLGISWRQN